MNKTNPPTSGKGDIRKKVREKIAKMTTEEKKRESINICDALRKIIKSRNPKTIITYMPLSDEVDIGDMLSSLKGINIISLPQEDTQRAITFPKESLILVPGRAFTKNGKRIGRGAGFYDRLLMKNPTAYTIGICFSSQIFSELPQDSWDRRMNEVVFGGNSLE